MNMTIKPCARFLALYLTLSLPAPAFALREIQTVDSGLEEGELTAALLGSTPATELEEGGKVKKLAKGAVLVTASALLGIAGETGYDAPAKADQIEPPAQVVPIEPVPKPLLTEKPASIPARRVLWVLGPHGRPGDFDGLVRQLRDTKGPSILLLEGGVPQLEMLKKSHPDVAQQLTMKKLNELVQLLSEKGEDAFLKDPLGAALKEILVLHWGFARRISENLRANPSRAIPLFRPLMEELEKRKDVKLEVEQAPLISFLNQLRADLSQEETVLTFFKDQQASLRTLVRHLRFQEISNEQRDQALGKERLPLILRNNPEATTVLVALGLGHLQGKSFAKVYRDLGFKEEIVRTVELPNHLKVFTSHRDALLKEQTTFAEQADVRRELLLYFPHQGLSTLIGGTTVEADRQVAEMLGTIKDEEIQTLLKELQIPIRQRILGPLASQSYDRWLHAVGLYTLGWLNNKLTPAMKAKLPEIYRDLNMREVDQILFNAGLEDEVEALIVDGNTEPERIIQLVQQEKTAGREVAVRYTIPPVGDGPALPDAGYGVVDSFNENEVILQEHGIRVPIRDINRVIPLGRYRQLITQALIKNQTVKVDLIMGYLGDPVWTPSFVRATLESYQPRGTSVTDLENIETDRSRGFRFAKLDADADYVWITYTQDDHRRTLKMSRQRGTERVEVPNPGSGISLSNIIRVAIVQSAAGMEEGTAVGATVERVALAGAAVNRLSVQEFLDEYREQLAGEGTRESAQRFQEKGAREVIVLPPAIDAGLKTVIVVTHPEWVAEVFSILQKGNSARMFFLVVPDINGPLLPGPPRLIIQSVTGEGVTPIRNTLLRIESFPRLTFPSIEAMRDSLTPGLAYAKAIEETLRGQPIGSVFGVMVLPNGTTAIFV